MKTTSTYNYPTAITPEEPADQPHTLTGVTNTVNGTPSSTTAYTYDNAGNTEQVTTGDGNQTLTWDSEGKLATLTNTDQTAETSKYTYDADGNRITRTDPGGTTTAFLPGLDLALAKGTATATATRYYNLPSGITYSRTTTSVQYQTSDHHGTGTLAINPDTGQCVSRRTDPYGNPRGEQPQPSEWNGSKGFVGGTVDPAGYIHLGAREYDPETGRFLSDDPVSDHSSSQQVNGFAYSSNSPVTFSDPTGLLQDAGDVGGGGGRSNSKKKTRSLSDEVSTDSYVPPGGCASGSWTEYCSSQSENERRSREYGSCGGKNCPLSGDEIGLKNSADEMLAQYGGDPEICVIEGIWCETDPDAGEYQIAWCRKVGILSCNTAHNLYLEALEISGQNEDGKWWDPIRNGKRHATWMALLVVRGFSPEDALALGVAHELDTQTFGNVDSRIDMNNNRAGIAIGEHLLATDPLAAQSSHVMTTINSVLASACAGEMCIDKTPRYVRK